MGSQTDGGPPGRVAYPLVSVLLLVPCWWQPRIQAGDLSSHIYNAWLAQLIGEGRAPGLLIAQQTTNVLFDLLLGGLLRAVGAGGAQRIAVSLAVLVFAWGAFAFAAAVAGRKPWASMPVVAMLSYGWVFHMGFFGFYLSLGLCFWALALVWESTSPPAIGGAAVLLALAWMAHALPVAWTVAAFIWMRLARRMTLDRLAAADAAVVAGLIAAHVALGRWTVTRWFTDQIFSATGLDQVAVFDGKYRAVGWGLLAVWGLGLAAAVRQSGVPAVFRGAAFQVWLLTALGIFLLPSDILLPGYRHVLAFIADRMSLVLGVVMCAALARAPLRGWQAGAAAIVAAGFFGMLWRDERVLNKVEDRMAAVVAGLPAGQRVVSALQAPGLRVNPLSHMLDRVCVEKCYSYANYEPSTSQFRVRAETPNGVVLNSATDSADVSNGTYVVKPADLPLYQVESDGSGRFTVRSLAAGAPNGVTQWNPLSE